MTPRCPADEHWPADKKRGYDDFFAGLPLPSHSSAKSKYVLQRQGWWIGNARAYAMGMRAACLEPMIDEPQLCPFPDCTPAADAWHAGFEDEDTLT